MFGTREGFDKKTLIFYFDGIKIAEYFYLK